MYNGVTRPERLHGSCSNAQIQDGASSASSGGNTKSTGSRVLFYLSENSNKSPEPLLDGSATSEQMSALLPFKFPASGKYDVILDSFVNTTPTMHVQTAKVLFDVTMHKVCFV